MGRWKPRIAERSVSAPDRGYPPGLKVERLGDNELDTEIRSETDETLKR